MTDNPNERFPLVDTEGNIIGEALRSECHNGSKLLHPVVHLHVFSPDGQLFLQQRPLWKDIQPGRWDTAVGGHIDMGERVEQALLREAAEELSLRNFEYELLGQYVFESSREREYVYSYRTITAQPPCPTAELSDGRFFSHEEILLRLGTEFFTPNFEQEYRRFFLS